MGRVLRRFIIFFFMLSLMRNSNQNVATVSRILDKLIQEGRVCTVCLTMSCLVLAIKEKKDYFVLNVLFGLEEFQLLDTLTQKSTLVKKKMDVAQTGRNFLQLSMLTLFRLLYYQINLRISFLFISHHLF